MLDRRLQAIADMVPVVRVAADIGADHGMLSEYLLNENRVEQMWVCDISAPSLEKARARLSDDRYTGRVHFAVSDGLKSVPVAPECAIVAGMGASTIRGIIADSRLKLDDATLVLQPNVDADELRAYLMNTNFAIEREDLIHEGRWWYVIIKAVRGQKYYSERELLAGPMLLTEHHPLLPEYARRKVRITRAALETVAPEHSRREVLERQLDIWNEIASRPD